MQTPVDQLNEFIATQLNKEQQKAVTQSTGSLLVIAGAGSGKTRVITARITNLIMNEGVPAHSIIALTFTNKAAREMKERIIKFLGTDAPLPFIGTFHAYCLKVLRTIYPAPFSILDSDDQQKLLTQIITRNKLKKQLTPRQAGYNISIIKNSIENNEDIQHVVNDQILVEVYKKYEAEKRASNCLDFDDLLIEVLKLFQSNPQFKEQFQQTVQHILVDEYQDTSVVQHALLKQMALNNKDLQAKSICVVGDEDQSIYSWRGATIDNIVNFKQDFAKTKTVKIEQNYRSVQQILDTAHSVIQNNVKRNPKKLWSEKKGSQRVHQLMCASGYQEADAIAWIAQSVPKKTPLNQVAVLYRTHFQSRSIEESLIKYGIPYKIVGGIQFYERKEIKDLIAYMRLLVNPLDRLALLRVLNCPKRGLGPKVEEQLTELWTKEPLLGYDQLLTQLSNELPTSKQESVSEFLTTFHQLDSESDPAFAIDKILKRTMYHLHLKEEHEPREAETRIDNTKEFIRAAEHFTQQGISTVSAMLYEISLMQEKLDAKQDETQQIQLMTLHAAKGLEFNTVIMAGVEEGLLPSSRSLESMDDIEEERRLTYVGITRAQEYLFFTYAGYRNTYGQTNYQEPSRFLQEIESALIARHDCSYWKEWEFKQLYAKLWKTEMVMPTRSIETFSTSRKATTKPKPTFTRSTTGKWKKMQPVQHKSFGTGVIQKIEKKGDHYNLTIKFKSGVKKIADSFVRGL